MSRTASPTGWSRCTVRERIASAGALAARGVAVERRMEMTTTGDNLAVDALALAGGA